MATAALRVSCARRICYVALASLLTGCVGSPEFVRPRPPIPPAWQDAGSAAPARIASALHWRDFFSEPRLQQLIDSALAHNRDLRAAAARIEVARAEHGISRANRLPAINATAGMNSVGRSQELAGAGNNRIEHRFDLAAGVVSFEVDFWNRLGSLSEAARANYLATEAAQRAVRLGLISEVANAYFALLETDERLEIARAKMETLDRRQQLVALAHSTGFASNLEKLNAEDLFHAARADVAQLTRQRATLRNTLDYLVGEPVDRLPGPQGLGALELDGNFSVALPSELLLARPDVAETEYRLLAAHANIDAARAAFFPKILLTASLGLASPTLASLFSASQGAWNFQPSMSMPIFDWGRLRGGIDLAEARRHVAVAEYEKTIQLAFREVADLLAERQSLIEQKAAADKQVAGHEERVATMLSRQREGVASLVNVLDAQRELLSARQAALQIRRMQLENATLLYKALGGGESSPPTQVAGNG